MKLNTLFVVAFGAALASVEATPLRVLVADATSQELARGLRFGHAVPPLPVRDMPQVEGRSVSTPNRSPCFMRKMAMKAINISNAFRKAVGLPLIESPQKVDINLPSKHTDKEPSFSILPFIGTPPTYVEVKDNGKGGIVAFTKGGERVRVVGPEGAVVIEGPDGVPHHDHPDRHGHQGHHHPHKHHPHRPHHPHRLCRNAPFLRRLTFALASLGKWEGRAVAFVLGCGLGVLLRMLWVLSVITYRSLNGNRREEVEYTVIHEYVDAAETPVPPPTYTYVDEKLDAKKNEENPAVAA